MVEDIFDKRIRELNESNIRINEDIKMLKISAGIIFSGLFIFIIAIIIILAGY